MWEAYAEYDDGTVINTTFPYFEHDNVKLENERQQEIEEFLIGAHDGCKYYSVSYIYDE